MNSLLDKVFGPLPLEYCEFFTVFSAYFLIKLIVSIIFLVMLAVSPSYVIPSFMRKYQDRNFSVILFGTAILIVVLYDGYGYFINRLLHSMCVGSLNKGNSTSMAVSSNNSIASTAGSCSTCGGGGY